MTVISVHPRACGERVVEDGQLVLVNGSSPRMRGTGTGRSVYLIVVRFIPAHAGNGKASYS